MSAEQEQKLVAPLLDQPLKVGETYNVVSKRWYLSWCDYAGVNSDKPSELKPVNPEANRPGPIDNADLIDKPSLGNLKIHLLEGQDFYTVPSKAYSELAKIYGGGPSIVRKVIAVGLLGEARLELFPQFVRLMFVDPATGEPKDEGEVRQLSGNATLDDLLKAHAPTYTNAKGTAVKREGRIWINKPKETPEGQSQPQPAEAQPQSQPQSQPQAQEQGEGEKAKEEVKEVETEWKLAQSTEKLAKIETLQLGQGTPLLLEFRTDEKDCGPYPRKTSTKANWRDFAVNDELDAQDSQNKWYMANIRDVKEDKVFVHFINWSSKWDEWIDRSSDRLAPVNTYTTGPYQPTTGPLSTSSYSSYESHVSGAPLQKGAVGLRNLGNTCFMNSTLQCLSNTPGLVQYFVEGAYLGEINRQNPLGWQGKVAEAYGALLKDIWGGQYSTVAPRQFKQVIGEFQPRFSGYAQHDSSELLSFLLDGLHEDLNRVLKKPATAPVDSNGRDDKIVAHEAWQRHLMRNQSVIVDQCQGQLKSRVVCPTCNRSSVTFDPFMFLSVPIPSVQERNINVFFVRDDDKGAEMPVIYGVRVPKSGATTADLKQSLIKLLNQDIPPQCLLISEIYQHKHYKVYGSGESIDRIRQPGDEIWAYHLPSLAENTPDNREYLSVSVVNQVSNTLSSPSPTGTPLAIALPVKKLNAMPMKELRARLRAALTPWLQGGWKAGESEKDLFSVYLTPKGSEKLVEKLPIDDENAVVDLPGKTNGQGIGFVLMWKSSERQRRAWSGQPVVDPSFHSTPQSSKSVALSECFDSFALEETLSQDDAWYCSHCKEHKCANKKMDLWKVPDVLILHLKRFKYSKYSRDKLDTLVEFPLEGLDLAPFVVNEDESKNAIYDLYAVSNHFGGLGGGHYTAFAKNIVDGQWYNLDDSSVSRVDPARIRSPAAYVLFYIRRQKRNVKNTVDETVPPK